MHILGGSRNVVLCGIDAPDDEDDKINTFSSTGNGVDQTEKLVSETRLKMETNIGSLGG